MAHLWSIGNHEKKHVAITTCKLFASLSETEIRNLLDQVQVKETLFNKGDILAMQGEQCNRLIILIEGSVAGEMTDPTGKVIKIEDIYAPNPLAILFLFGTQNRFPVQATARENVKALVIPKQSVLKMLSVNESFLKNYLDLSANYASRLSQKLHFMTFRTIRQKLSMYLLNLAEIAPDTVILDRTQTALAEYFGISRPSLSRELKKMHDDRLIQFSKKQIVFSDKQKLISIVKF